MPNLENHSNVHHRGNVQQFTSNAADKQAGKNTKYLCGSFAVSFCVCVSEHILGNCAFCTNLSIE